MFFIFKILPILLNLADGLFGVKLQYLTAKTIKKLFLKSVKIK
jgi:hypothetical protein